MPRRRQAHVGIGVCTSDVQKNKTNQVASKSRLAWVVHRLDNHSCIRGCLYRFLSPGTIRQPTSSSGDQSTNPVHPHTHTHAHTTRWTCASVRSTASDRIVPPAAYLPGTHPSITLPLVRHRSRIHPHGHRVAQLPKLGHTTRERTAPAAGWLRRGSGSVCVDACTCIRPPCLFS